jgi:FG-GAP-like repeat
MSTVSWEGAAGGDWANGANWDFGLVPTTSEDAQIELPGVYTVSITSADTADDLTINAASATLAETGGSLHLSGSLNLYNGYVSLNAANSIANSILMEGGVLAVGNSGALGQSGVLFYGGELLATTSETLTNSFVLEDAPTIAVATGKTLTLTGGSTVTGPATLTFGAPGAAGTVFWNANSFQASGTSPYNIDVRDGTLEFGNFDEGMTFLSPAAWNSVDIESGATLDVNGVRSTFDRLTGGGLLTSSAGATVTLGGGKFSGTINGDMNLDITGQVELAGSTTVGAIEIGNGSALTNLTNDPGGFFNLDTSSDISENTGASNAYFANQGTLLRNGFPGAGIISAPFYNFGTMRITSGSETFTAGFANAGTLEGRLTTSGSNTIWTPDPAESDLNGDSLSDVLLRNGSGSFVDWTMSGSAIASSTYITSGGNAVNLAPAWTVDGVADLNGDGKADVFLRNSNGTFADWTMNGSQITSSQLITSQGATVTLGSAWNVSGLGDFNGDGDADILLRNSNGTLADWTMNGSQLESSQLLTAQGAPITLASAWSVAGVGDFNGDGLADVLLRNSNGTLADWTMNGSQIESAQIVTYQGAAVTLDPSWSIAAIGDFSGDGKADIMLRNTSGAFQEWTMNGSAIAAENSVTAGGQAVLTPAWQTQGSPTDLAFV